MSNELLFAHRISLLQNYQLPTMIASGVSSFPFATGQVASYVLLHELFDEDIASAIHEQSSSAQAFLSSSNVFRHFCRQVLSGLSGRPANHLIHRVLPQ